MNIFVFMGRLTKDPAVRYTQDGKAIADFSLAVDRFGGKEADFFRVVTFGKQAEFAEKYLHKGTKVVVQGRVENDNYTNKDGQKVFGMRFIASQIEFAEGKKAEGEPAKEEPRDDDFIHVPDSVADAGLPFN